MIMKTKFFGITLALCSFFVYAQTANNFMQQCESKVSKEPCLCVYQKLEFSYSGKELLVKDSLWRLGEIDSLYKETLISSMKACGIFPEKNLEPAEWIALFARANDASKNSISPISKGMYSSEESAKWQKIARTNKFKKSFQSECVDELDDFFEKKTAGKICACAYDQLLDDTLMISLVPKAVDKEGKADDFDKWGAPLLKNCLPETYTQEMEKVFIKECKDDASKPSCKCSYEWVKENYTVHEFIQKEMEDEPIFKQKQKETLLRCQK